MLGKLGRLAKRFSAYEKFRGFKNHALDNLELDGVTIVKSEKHAKKVISILKSLKDRYFQVIRIHAWDTETCDIEVKEQSPVGNGKIICFSGFCGPDIDFGNGPRLFVDNFGERADLILLFKDYFESNKILKAWFNYGFDRHVFYNHGINVRGFGGDAMHMARLADPSRGPQEYSLSNLTSYYSREILSMKYKIIDNLKSDKNLSENALNLIKKFEKNGAQQVGIKTKLNTLFKRPKILKNGQPGKTFEVPSIEELHTKAEEVETWVQYSTLDAESTYFLREVLVQELRKFKVEFEGMNNLFDLYCKYWLPFGEILTELERNGIRVNKEHLSKAEMHAQDDLNSLERKFKDWVLSIRPDLDEFNPSSTQQLQQLLFAPFKRTRKVKKPDASPIDEEILKDFDQAELDMLDNGGLSKGNSERTPRNIDTNMDFPEVRGFKVPNNIVAKVNKGFIEEGSTKPLKSRTMNIEGLGIKPPLFTDSGLPSVDVQALHLLAGNVDKEKYGHAFDHFS